MHSFTSEEKKVELQFFVINLLSFFRMQIRKERFHTHYSTVYIGNPAAMLHTVQEYAKVQFKHIHILYISLVPEFAGLSLPLCPTCREIHIH